MTRVHEWAWGDVGRRTCCGFEPLEPGARLVSRGRGSLLRRIRAVDDLGVIAPAERCRNCERMRAAIGASSRPVLSLDRLPVPTVEGEPGAVEVAEAERDVMEHATGWRSKWPLYRNHFCAGEGHDSWTTLQALIGRGLVRVSRRPSELSGGDTVFSVTASGIAALDPMRMGSRARGARRAGQRSQAGGAL